MPEVIEITLPQTALMGVAFEYSEKAWPADNEKPAPYVFDRDNRQQYYIEVFKRGSLAFDCSVTPGEPWITVSDHALRITEQERIYLGVNWDLAPGGLHSVPVKIMGPEGQWIEILMEVDNRPNRPEITEGEVFFKNRGAISMEADHFLKAVGGSDVDWHVIPNLGRTGSSVITLPVTADPSEPGGDSPHLEYHFYTGDTGLHVVYSYLSPTLNFHNNDGISFAVSIDDEAPQMVNMHENDTVDLWRQWVADNINIQTSRHLISEPGIHTLKWWRVDAGVVLQKIVIQDDSQDAPSYLGPPESIRIIPKSP
jgi:hypothetical protein